MGMNYEGKCKFAMCPCNKDKHYIEKHTAIRRYDPFSEYREDKDMEWVLMTDYNLEYCRTLRQWKRDRDRLCEVEKVVKHLVSINDPWKEDQTRREPPVDIDMAVACLQWATEVLKAVGKGQDSLSDEAWVKLRGGVGGRG